jgi:hypothetical protein
MSWDVSIILVAKLGIRGRLPNVNQDDGTRDSEGPYRTLTKNMALRADPGTPDLPFFGVNLCPMPTLSTDKKSGPWEFCVEEGMEIAVVKIEKPHWYILPWERSLESYP